MEASSMKARLIVIVAVLGVLGAAGMDCAAAGGNVHFVPNSFEFWDFSKNWTTNYGPAYRDTVESPTDFLACQGQFALCFHSGPEPLPCHMTEDGRFAKCTCKVENDTNYVLSTAILNRNVYEKTIEQCPDGNSSCPNPGDAPVCSYLPNGKLIPGADVISTYDTSTAATLQAAIVAPPGSGILQACEGPCAGCMTAPCTLKKNGEAECTCPVFWGSFQLVGPNAQCSLGGDLVPSASYNPKHDPNVP